MRNPALYLLILISIFLSACIPANISEQEKSLLITENDLGQFLGEGSTNLAGKYSKTLYEHRSKEIEYEFDPEQTDTSVLFLSHTITFDAILSEAKDDYILFIAAYNVGGKMSSSDVTYVQLNNTQKYGDQSYIAIIKKDDNEIGNVLVVRRANTIHSLIFSGVYFDDTDYLFKFVSSKFMEADKYNQNIISDLKNLTS